MHAFKYSKTSPASVWRKFKYISSCVGKHLGGVTGISKPYKLHVVMACGNVE